ncbi:LysR family transcriptional regulator [Morganella morganii]|uniref:helix-turn-helix domain-containing protein n=1 Tax=Morganella morganii TaxID=582 RepID=UPI0034E1E0AF|nr:LysR family transcriptional regulator [Morganella morganii]
MLLSGKLCKFVSVVENRSIKKASEQMNVTASAISQGISSLEKELGMKLIKKTVTA